MLSSRSSKSLSKLPGSFGRSSIIENRPICCGQGEEGWWVAPPPPPDGVADRSRLSVLIVFFKSTAIIGLCCWSIPLRVTINDLCGGDVVFAPNEGLLLIDGMSLLLLLSFITLVVGLVGAGGGRPLELFRLPTEVAIGDGGESTEELGLALLL